MSIIIVITLAITVVCSYNYIGKAGRKILVIGYNSAGEIEVLQELDDTIGTVAFETKNPTVIFAFVIAQSK